MRVGIWPSIPETPGLILLANLLVGFFGLLTVPIITNSVGPTGRGITASAVVLFGVVPILLAFGMPLAIRRRVIHERQDPVIRAYRDLTACTTIPAALAGILLVGSLFRHQDRILQSIVLVGIVVAPLTVSWMGDASVLVSHGRYRRVFAMRIAPSLIVLTILSFGWLADLLTVEIILLAQIIGTMATFALGLTLVRVSWLGPRASRRSIAREGTKYAGAAIAEAASYRLDQALLLPLIGAFQTGLYSVAVSIASVPDAVGQALGAPNYRRMGAERDEFKRRSLAADAAGSASSMACVVATLVGLLAIPTLAAVFGETFSSARVALAIVLVASVILVVGRVLALGLAAEGRGQIITLAQIAGLLTGLVLLYPLARQWGASGAAVAASIGYAVTTVIVFRAAHVPLRRLAPNRKGLRRAMLTLRAR